MSYIKYAEHRDEKGITDYRVAVETGIPKSTFSDWKNNRSKPKVEKLIKIANYLDVSIEELI